MFFYIDHDVTCHCQKSIMKIIIIYVKNFSNDITLKNNSHHEKRIIINLVSSKDDLQCGEGVFPNWIVQKKNVDRKKKRLIKNEGKKSIEN